MSGLSSGLIVGKPGWPGMAAPSIVLFGDSRTNDCDYTDTLNRYSTNMSWFDWGQHFATSGPVFEVIRNAGIFGDTTARMLTRVGSDVFALKPSYMTLWGGTNDDWSAGFAGVDKSAANMAEICRQANAQGIYVFLISETTSNQKGTTFPALVQYYNEQLRGIAATLPGVEFWDFNAQIVDPTSANGYQLNPMLRDGIHLSPLGASAIGKNIVAPKLARFAPIVSLPVSLIDTQGNNGFVRNILPNPLMTGSTGTISSNASGTLPANWTGSGSNANIAAAFSIAARADGVGNDIQCVATAAAAGSMFLALPITAARLVPGGRYVIEAAYSVSNPTALCALSFNAQIFNGGTLYTIGHGTAVQSPVATDTIAAAAGILRTRRLTCPSGFTPSSAQILVTARFAGAGGATFKMGRFAMKQVA